VPSNIALSRNRSACRFARGSAEDVGLVGVYLGQRIAQQALLGLVEVRKELRAFAEHPVQPAVGLAFKYLFALGGQVQVAEQFAHLGAMLGIGLLDVLARQARLQQAGLPASSRKAIAVGGTQGVRHRQVGVVEHVKQFDEERHFLHRAALDQGQDEFALFQADEEIGVFAASGNPLEIKQAAEPIRGEKGFQLGPSQGGEHRHG
jgi:hypothetical protein